MSQQTEKKTTLRPLLDRVLVQRIEQEETLKGGIILPETAKKKQEIAKVIAVGKGKNAPMPVKVGETVLLDKYSGQEVTIDNEEYLVLKSDEIIAIIEE